MTASRPLRGGLGAGSPQPDALVALTLDEARLLEHVLASFERLLRHGGLDPDQIVHLLPPGVGCDDPDGDVIMAEVVVDAGEPLRRQLG
jgi:hypothetical protein